MTMRVLFIVQGEGRGHLTQAISAAQLLRTAGHQVIGAWVNVAEGRPVPDFFRAQFNEPITAVKGPLLVYNPDTNALDLGTTIRLVLSNLKGFYRSLQQLRAAIDEHKPDVVVNFFELMGGLTYGMFRPPVPMVCLGHQCMALHPIFPFPAGQWLNRLLFKGLVRLNAWGAIQRIGLSFDEQPDVPHRRLQVIPPLLRRELTDRKPTIAQPANSGFILAYTTQPGLLTEVLKAHQQQPGLPIRYFYSLTTKSEEKYDNTLSLYRIDGQRYLGAMQRCRAVLTTAGFESVCEALYLGKPVLMMPQPRHYEQACNALDGQRAGAGVADKTFNLNHLLNYIPLHDERASIRFRAWHAKGESRLIAALQGVVDANQLTRSTSFNPPKNMPNTPISGAILKATGLLLGSFRLIQKSDKTLLNTNP